MPQVKLVTGGQPYVMFGDGRLAACKPISEADLAAFMAECVRDPSKANRVLPIGGGLPLIVSILCINGWKRMHSTVARSDAILLGLQNDEAAPCQCCRAVSYRRHRFRGVRLRHHPLKRCMPAPRMHGARAGDRCRAPCAGPGKAWTARDQGEYLFQLAERKPWFIQVPVALMDGIIAFLDALARVFPGLEVCAHPYPEPLLPGMSRPCC